MGLTKYKLGELIASCENRNTDGTHTVENVRGISTDKTFIETKANMDGVSLSSYKLVKQNEFSYVSDTSRRGDKIAIAFNRLSQTILVSSIYTVFRVVQQDLLLPEYLFMFFNRPEFDRYSRFNSWGSARETFDWSEMCGIDIDLPDLQTQQKYVNIYLSMVANQQSYERGLEDLKIVCDGYIEELRRKMPCEKIGPFLLISDQRNDFDYQAESVRGISTNKELIPTKADLDGVGLGGYKTVSPRQIVYVPDTSRRGEKVSLGYNNTEETYLVSSISSVFGTREDRLLPDYLMLFFTRSEFDRYARFHSWGSARETFDWEEMCNVEIPIPDIEIQKSIAEIYAVYIKRREINEKLKAQIRDICPVLIKGSLEEGRMKSHDD